MASNKWVYEKATGKWLLDFRDPSIYLTDSVNYGVADLGDAVPSPDAITERYDAVAKRSRAATPSEIAESQSDAMDLLAIANVDRRRLVGAIVWAIIDTYSPPATVAKFNNARAKILNAYKNRPWLP